MRRALAVLALVVAGEAARAGTISPNSITVGQGLIDDGTLQAGPGYKCNLENGNGWCSFPGLTPETVITPRRAAKTLRAQSARLRADADALDRAASIPENGP